MSKERPEVRLHEIEEHARGIGNTIARVLDQLGGWTQGSTMREGTYQDKESDTVAAESAALRARVRPTIGITEGE